MVTVRLKLLTAKDAMEVSGFSSGLLCSPLQYAPPYSLHLDLGSVREQVPSRTPTLPRGTKYQCRLPIRMFLNYPEELGI
jgi:hypothetical protein